MRTLRRAVAGLAVLLVGAVAFAALPDADRVEAALVPVGQARALQTKSKMSIRSMTNSKKTVVQVMADPMKPSNVILTGLAPGVSRVKLTDINGATEEVIVAVE